MVLNVVKAESFLFATTFISSQEFFVIAFADTFKILPSAFL